MQHLFSMKEKEGKRCVSNAMLAGAEEKPTSAQSSISKAIINEKLVNRGKEVATKASSFRIQPPYSPCQMVPQRVRLWGVTNPVVNALQGKLPLHTLH